MYTFLFHHYDGTQAKKISNVYEDFALFCVELNAFEKCIKAEIDHVTGPVGTYHFVGRPGYHWERRF